MQSLTSSVRLHEYSVAAAVELSEQPIGVFPSSLHETPGPSRVVPLDLSAPLGIPHAATSPNLLASFIVINAAETVASSARATSQAFFVVRGSGTSTSDEHGTISWGEGDLFVLPRAGTLLHTAAADCGVAGSAALYTINDEPLLRYLGVHPSEDRFGAALYTRDVLLSKVEEVRHEPGAEHRNRMGILLSNMACPETKTLTPILWALLNVLPANTKQPPHRHQSVAIDLCVSVAPGAEGKVYTLMGKELGDDGWLAPPFQKCVWASGSVFTTPPGWWHSHHNTSDHDAWVLPTQCVLVPILARVHKEGGSRARTLTHTSPPKPRAARLEQGRGPLHVPAHARHSIFSGGAAACGHGRRVNCGVAATTYDSRSALLAHLP